MNIVILMFIILSALSSMGVPLPESQASREKTENEITKHYATYIHTKARAFEVMTDRYPTYDQFITGDPKIPESKLGSTEKKLLIRITPTSASADKIQYKFCSSNGAEVIYYDRVEKKTVPFKLGEGCDVR